MTFTMREPLPIGGSLVRTVSFQLVQELGVVVHKIHGMLVVEGASGAGKSTAIEHLLSTLPAECVVLHLGNLARGNEVATELAELLGAESLGTSGKALRKALKRALKGRNVVIFVDEADRLNADGLRCLRYLWDQPGRTWCLILAGRDFDRAFALVPEIGNRQGRYAPFDPLSGPSLVKALQSLHPLFANTGESVLKEIDASSCHGLLVSWTIVLAALLSEGADPETGFDIEFARPVLAKINRRAKKGPGR
jgi:AAA domain